MLAHVFWTGIGVIAVSLCMLAAVFLLRLGLVSRRRREQQFMARWQPVFAQCVDSVPKWLPPLAKADHYTFLQLLNHHHELLRGHATHNLNMLAIAAGMQTVVRDMLEHRNMRERMIAVATLGHLGDKSKLNELRRLVDHSSALLSLVAMRALLEIDPAATLTWLIPVIGAREDWPLAKVAVILEDIGSEQVTLPLIAAVEAAFANAPRQVSRLLHLLEVANADQVAPAVRRILQHTDDEHLIADGLRHMRNPSEIEMARHFAIHSDSMVRVGAAQALGSIGMPEDRILLTNMLGDPNWLVRNHAARALIGLPSARIDELRKIRAILPDRFAADMLGQVIAEHESR
jgi:HEAT repeat protein